MICVFSAPLQGHAGLGDHFERAGRAIAVIRDLLGGDGEDVLVLRPRGPIPWRGERRDQRRRQEPGQLGQVDGGGVQAGRGRRRGRFSGDLAAAAGGIGQFRYELETGAADFERDDARGRHLFGGARQTQAGGALRGQQEQRRGAGEVAHALERALVCRFGRLDQACRSLPTGEHHRRAAPQLGDGAVNGL